jgi:hypothetical protein
MSPALREINIEVAATCCDFKGGYTNLSEVFTVEVMTFGNKTDLQLEIRED